MLRLIKSPVVTELVRAEELPEDWLDLEAAQGSALRQPASAELRACCPIRAVFLSVLRAVCIPGSEHSRFGAGFGLGISCAESLVDCASRGFVQDCAHGCAGCRFRHSRNLHHAPTPRRISDKSYAVADLLPGKIAGKRRADRIQSRPIVECLNR